MCYTPESDIPPCLLQDNSRQLKRETEVSTDALRNPSYSGYSDWNTTYLLTVHYSRPRSSQMAAVWKEACACTWFTLSADRRALLAALELGPQTDLVIDLCMNDLQTHGHRRLLTTDEGEKELTLWSTAKTGQHMRMFHSFPYISL